MPRQFKITSKIEKNILQFIYIARLYLLLSFIIL